MNYIKATNLKPGLLINFGSYPKVEIECFVLYSSVLSLSSVV
ncbi:GxxExxY protein [Desulforhopalus vacuolatus]